MKRGTAAKVILGKDTLMDVPAGIVHGTDVILGGKAGLLNDFGGLVLSNNLMLGKKVSRGTITTVTVRGQSPLVLPDAIAGSLQAVKAFGGTEQNGTPTPDAPVDIVSNNGALKLLTSATGTGTQSGTPTPTNPIYPVFYKQGDMILRCVGDYADSYDATTKKITRRVGVKVFDGTENFFASGAGWAYGISDKIRSKVLVYCTHYPYSSATMANAPDKSIITFSSQNIGFKDSAFTSGADVSAFCLQQYNASTPVTVYYPLETPVEEDWTTPIIYTDGTVETINAHGKNLNGGGALGNQGYTSTGGVSTSSTFCGTLYKIKVKPDEKYTVSFGNFPDGISGVFINTWLTDGTWNLRQAIAISGAYTYTIPAGVGEVNFTLYKTGGITIADNSWLQVERGDTATDYEPYYDGGTATAEMLLKIGDYQDEHEILSGAVTRNIGVKVLDGTEDWSKRTDTGVNRYQANILPDKVSGGLACICSHFQNVLAFANLNDNCFIVDATARIIFDEEDITTLADWKAWLASQYAAGTPVIVAYPLATATTESVAGQTLQVKEGDNMLEITQASLTGLELEATYKSLVQLTIQEVEDANLNNNVEVTIS